jgi:hypothetical protein
MVNLVSGLFTNFKNIFNERRKFIRLKKIKPIFITSFCGAPLGD